MVPGAVWSWEHASDQMPLRSVSTLQLERGSDGLKGDVPFLGLDIRKVVQSWKQMVARL